MKIKLSVLLASITILAAGCGLKNKQKVEAHQRWCRTRALVICSLGAEHLKVGDLDKAGASAGKALALDTDCVGARLLLGKILLEKGRYVEAIDQLRKGEAMAPENAEFPYLIGAAQEKRGKYDEAVTSYQKARALDASNDAYVMALAEVLVSAGKPRLALELLASRLERTDGNASMTAMAGELAMLVDAPARSVEFYQRCLDTDPENPQAREGLAKAQFFAGQHAHALIGLSYLAGQDPYKDKVAWVYIMIGDCHMAMNRPRAAREAYAAATRIDAGEARVWLRRAQASLSCGDARGAEHAARQALDLTDSLFEAKIVLSFAMLAQGRGADAARTLAKLARDRPGDPTVLCMLGRCCARMGRRDQAAKYYAQALQSDPKHSLAKRLLASTTLQDQQLPE